MEELGEAQICWCVCGGELGRGSDLLGREAGKRLRSAGGGAGRGSDLLGEGGWEEAQICWVDLLCFVWLPCLLCCTNPIECQDLASYE